MRSNGNGCTTTCDSPRPAAPASLRGSEAITIGLLASFLLGTIAATVASVAASRPAAFAPAVPASAAPERGIEVALLEELRRPAVDIGRILALARAAGMERDEALGALTMARRAALAGHEIAKARALAEASDRLRAGNAS